MAPSKNTNCCNRTYTIDLRSDTLSKPNAEMRQRMFEAEVGDSVYGEDATVNELESRIASLFGKEAALYVASGTMSNLLAILAHCEKRGSEIIVGSKSHILMYEQTGASQYGGINMRELSNNADGTFNLDELEEKIRIADAHEPVTALICIENTHNSCGGKALPLEWLNQVSYIGNKRNIPLHVDGSRILDAAVYCNVPVSKLVNGFDSISLCFSKSLGAPIGSALIGSKRFIDKANYIRKGLGGGWRQAGFMAAACLYSIDNMIERLKQDHRRVKKIASAIRKMKSPNIRVDENEDIHTNMLLMYCDSDKFQAEDFVNRLCSISEEELSNSEVAISVKTFSLSKNVVRLVVYCNITEEDVDKTIQKIEYVIRECDSSILDLRTVPQS